VDGRVRATVNALSYRTTLGYDAASRQVTVKNPLGFVVTSILDQANRLRASVDQLANRVTFSYDVASRRVAVQNPIGNRTTTIYNADNSVRATVNPLGYRTTLAYNPAGWRTAVVDSNANRTTMPLAALWPRSMRWGVASRKSLMPQAGTPLWLTRARTAIRSFGTGQTGKSAKWIRCHEE
jgi:YD repeat-containing protein